MTSDQVGVRNRVGIYSTAPIRLAGICDVFERRPEIQPVVNDLETLLGDLALKYLILDLSQDTSWLDLVLVVRRSRPELNQIVLGPAGNEDLVMKSILAGARAYLDSHAGPLALRQAVDVVISGSIWAPRRVLTKLVDKLLNQPVAVSHTISPIFSRRERQVLDLILGACSNREIAEELGIEERTVKAYVGNLLRKTGAANRVSLSVLATQGTLGESREKMG
jgi:DNA-binding NarL/FixJ family response regulator